MEQNTYILDINDEYIKNILNNEIQREIKNNGSPLFLNENQKYKMMEKVLMKICYMADYDFEKATKDNRAREFILSRIQEECFEETEFYTIKDTDDYDTNWYDGLNVKNTRFECLKKSLRDGDMSERAIINIDKDTNKIMNLINNPNVKEPFKVIGQVMGEVQSGKTTLFTGTANKCFDAGYRIVIIVAGMSSELRNLTQRRVESACYGIDTIDKTRIGIGKYLNHSQMDEILIYTRRDKDDERSKEKGELVSRGLESLQIKDKKVILVCKRNIHVTQRIINWIKSQEQFNRKTGKLEGIPTIIIADECDEATVNMKTIKGKENNNVKIRKLISNIEQVSYVGFSATPFANIYMDPYEKDENIGHDLFPRNFMCYFEPAKTYVGAREFFGEKEAYPYTRIVGKQGDIDFTEKLEIIPD